jgi:soluble lytic murein transglycosylase-like protein
MERNFVTEQAVPLENERDSGSCSVLILPPLAVLIVSALLGVFAFKANVQAESISADSFPVSTALSPIFKPEVQHWSESVSRWAAASGLDPNLVAVVMQIESCGDARARSPSGAMGLFQVMPYHFYSTDDPYDPDTNALRGLAYLDQSLRAAQGDPCLALAGYNGGLAVISRPEWTWSSQTTRYVYYGAAIYEDARRGSISSPMLDEWYARYGISLCRQAAERLDFRE